MELIKKYWYVTVVLLGTAALGVSTLLVSLRIQQRSAVIREDSRAATPECTLTFTIQNPTPTTTPGICELSFALTVPTNTPTNVPTNTPTNTPTNIPSNTPTSTPTNTPTGTATPGPSPTPTNTPSSTPTNIPTNTPGPTATPGPTSTPTNTPSVTATLRPTNTPAPGACNYACKTNSDCGNSLVCSNGFCRNPQCTEQPNCACYFVPTPKVPVTGMGTTLLGVGVIAGGVVLLLLGFIL